LSFRAIAWVLDQKPKSPTAKFVLLVIASYADEHGIAWPSQERLARDTGLGVRTIRRSIVDLTAEGFLEVLARRPRSDGQRETNLMRLTGSPEARMAHGSISQRPHSPKPEATVASKPVSEPPPYSSHGETRVSTGRGYPRGQRRSAAPVASMPHEDEPF
jgi:hypothetical protein